MEGFFFDMSSYSRRGVALGLVLEVFASACSEPAGDACVGAEIELREPQPTSIEATELECSAELDHFCYETFVARFYGCGDIGPRFASIEIADALRYRQILITVELDGAGVPVAAVAGMGGSGGAPVEAGWISFQALDGCRVSGEFDFQWSFGNVRGRFKESAASCSSN